MMASVLLILAFVLLLGGRDVRAQEATGALDWPAITKVNRPWTRWWWQGTPRVRENMGERGLFDTSEWKPLPSGLLGPVTLRPVASI